MSPKHNDSYFFTIQISLFEKSCSTVITSKDFFPSLIDSIRLSLFCRRACITNFTLEGPHELIWYGHSDVTFDQKFCHKYYTCKAFFSSWTDLTWLSKSSFWEESASQMLHLNGFFCSWTDLPCSFVIPGVQRVLLADLVTLSQLGGIDYVLHKTTGTLG